MRIDGRQLAKLQIAIAKWIELDGGQFGVALQRKEVKTLEGTLTVNEVSLRMAEAAAAAYELAASASGRSSITN